MPESGKRWSHAETCRLKELARSGTSTGAIALELGRSKVAVNLKASRLGIRLGQSRRGRITKN